MYLNVFSYLVNRMLESLKYSGHSNILGGLYGACNHYNLCYAIFCPRTLGPLNYPKRTIIELGDLRAQVVQFEF
jgi:hypothetical protein